MTQLEMEDIQGIVFSGYDGSPSASYLFLEVIDRRRAGEFLTQMASSITTGAIRSQTTINLALTAGGLAALGLPNAWLATFALEFRQGMSGSEHRSRILGDVIESDPKQWSWGTTTRRQIDVMLMLFAPDETSLAAMLSQVRRDCAGALGEVLVRDTVRLADRREHFGFADSIAQPAIAGTRRATPENPGVKAGEFILGYENEYGKMPQGPSVVATLDPEDHLRPLEQGAGKEVRDLGRNGTYLVVRQLEQRVEEFWKAMVEYSSHAGQVDKAKAIRLAAKCVGRWPSGAPLVLSPDDDDTTLSGADDFMYSEADPRGLACPIGSHIRRTNPRDSLEPGPAESLKVVNRHRIIRRGRSYGPPLAPFAEDPDKAERGLLFVCINANIERQFEFIQHTWSNNPKFAGLSEDRDPLIGDQPAAGGTFTIPEVPVRSRLENLSRFVRVRGGQYFFLPSVGAIRFLGACAVSAQVAEIRSVQNGSRPNGRA